MMATFFIAGRMRLAFAVLEAFAGARLAVLLALSHAWIAGQQPFSFQRRPKVGVHSEQGARNTMANSPRLTTRTTASYCHLRVQFVSRPGHVSRLSCRDAA